LKIAFTHPEKPPGASYGATKTTATESHRDGSTQNRRKKVFNWALRLCGGLGIINFNNSTDL